MKRGGWELTKPVTANYYARQSAVTSRLPCINSTLQLLRRITLIPAHSCQEIHDDICSSGIDAVLKNNSLAPFELDITYACTRRSENLLPNLAIIVSSIAITIGSLAKLSGMTLKDVLASI